MKRFLLILLLAFAFTTVPARDLSIDSLKQALKTAGEDTMAVNLYAAISRYYMYKNPDSVLFYALPGLTVADKLGFPTGKIAILNALGEAYNTRGNYPKALETKLLSLKEAEKLNNAYLVASCQNYMGALYYKTEDYRRSLHHYEKAATHRQYFNDFKKYLLGTIGACYLHLAKSDSAYTYIKQSYDLDRADVLHWTAPYYFMGELEENKGSNTKALKFYREGNDVADVRAFDILIGYQRMASVFRKAGYVDSAIFYARSVIQEGARRSYHFGVREASSILTEIYKTRNNLDSAFHYQQIMLAAKDSLFSTDKVKLILNLSFDEQQRQEQLAQARKDALQKYNTKVKLYSLLAGLAILSLIVFILYRSNSHKQKDKIKIEKAYTELKITQAQLIQSEKMASMGELTAGIAHEIQNPLNFVNNFSDVNGELIDEMQQEMDKGNYADAKAISNDIKENEEKIRHHGKRADAIVKGMLQHSRSSSGVKEPTDINRLADEYLKLAYHGMKAKNKELNATLTTEFDETIGNINIIPQDIGRVLLNLYNNAFYAVNEEKKQIAAGLAPFQRLATLYEPTVTVSTKKIAGKVLISVRDNGPGIPQKIVDKIFQPFFTTKPTGQGTGLGLSLAYDIVKSHGGELKVTTKENEGTEFTISLPE